MADSNCIGWILAPLFPTTLLPRDLPSLSISNLTGRLAAAHTIKSLLLVYAMSLWNLYLEFAELLAIDTQARRYLHSRATKLVRIECQSPHTTNIPCSCLQDTVSLL